MSDKEKDNMEVPNLEESQKKNNFSPVEDFSIDDLPDETPKVSIAKKKNAVLLIGVIVIFLAIMFTLFTKNQEKQAVKNVVKTEVDEMKPENMPAGSKPGGTAANSVSASAASIGSSPTLNPLQARQAQVQETLPPPPTLPPVVNPSSIYIPEQENTTATSLSAPPAASLGAFGERYTKARDRLPEVLPQQSTDMGLGEDGLVDVNAVDQQAQAAIDADRQARISANMFVISGTDGGGQDGTAPVADEYTLQESSAASSEVGVRKDLERVILQGKIIEGVLETAINTDLPGKLRGIISRDVYSEDGRRVVIPKGSRLIGSYSTQVKFGQARVYVIWSRVIRPDGIDAVLDGSEAVDSLGRTGVYGDLDNRFFEIFGSSILLSTLTVAFAVAADAATGSDSSSTTTTTNNSTTTAGSSTTSTSDPVSEGVSSAITKVGSDTANIASQMFNNTPRITVDQGTRIKIFVNKDILFPPSYFFTGKNISGVQMMN